jgi:hypothetical protein
MFRLQTEKNWNKKRSCRIAEGIILFKQKSRRRRMESASRHRAPYKFPCFSSRSTDQAHLSLSSQTVQRQCYCARGVQSAAGAESICERQAKAAMECPVAAARDGLAPRQLPPGFRFHPTDQELVVHYLRRKALSRPLPAAVIPVVHDVARLDPWDFPGACAFLVRAVIGICALQLSSAPQNQRNNGSFCETETEFGCVVSLACEGEAYFFSLQRVPVTGGGRRRSARSGYWKATRKAKPVFLQGSGCGGNRYLVGVKTALAFHRDEPSRASRIAWVMHEYRLAVPGGVAEQRKHATQVGIPIHSFHTSSVILAELQ